MDKWKAELIEDARISIGKEIRRAHENRNRVRIALRLPGSGIYYIDGYIDAVGPYSLTLRCENEDAIYTETVHLKDVRMVSVFEDT